MTPGLNIFTSNRLEILSSKLVTLLGTPLPDVFQREIVVVQSRGMARWLHYQVAGTHKISANIEFPFPRAFAYRLFARLNGAASTESPWAPEVLLWRVLKALPEHLPAKAFEMVRSYGEGENASLRLYQLAARIAHAFDQYPVFRPEMVLGWDRGQDNHWQATLWRALAEQTGAAHPASLREYALRVLHRGKPNLGDLPPRISIFGISTLPKFYLDLFAALGRHRQVNIFLLQPTQESWDHITSKRESERIAAKANLSQMELHLEEGHPLLASWGTQGREFFRNVMECEPDGEDPEFVPNDSPALLHQLQDDILALRNRDGNPGMVERTDTSIQFHSCHSPVRELEVLRDQMLSWFQADPTLRPRDILVMMPDVEAYTPLIQAVFDVPERKKEMIPFSIADRSVKAESQLAETLLTILNLPERRCTARELLALLDCRSLLTRFELVEADLPLIHRWLLKAGVRWGIDADHRASFDLPRFEQNCWEHGMERLLLGYGMLNDGDHLFQGRLPVDEVEGSDAEVLGRFAELVHTVFTWCDRLKVPRTLAEWSVATHELLNSFFVSDADTESQLLALRAVGTGMAQHGERSEFSDALPLSVYRAHLQSALESGGFAGGFLDGGVTFCALKPMRSLPFKVVCLLGMNDTAFPRQNASVGFDLLQAKPMPSDPSNRKDDQYLFLESILAARQRLHISYVGQSVKDNKPHPPSVLVSELLDHLVQSFRFGDAPLKESDLLVRHRLQAFSPEYFKGERLFTYSQANARALKAQQRDRVEMAPFLSTPLPDPTEEFSSVNLYDLAEFLAHPAKHFLRKRMRLELAREEGLLEECEPFVVSGLDGYQIKQELLQRSLEGVSPVRSLELLQARGVLPYGAIGESTFHGLCTEVDAIAAQIRPHLTGPIAPLFIDLKVGEFRLSGEMPVSASGFLQYRCAKVKGADILRAWVYHVALNAARPEKIHPRTILVGTDSVHEFAPIAEAKTIAASLLELYWRGMCEPLKLFPTTSYEYAKAALLPNRSKSPPLRAAERTWETSDWHHGESEDSWFHFCFKGTNPLDNEFQRLSLEVFTPLFRVMQEMEVTVEL